MHTHMQYVPEGEQLAFAFLENKDGRAQLLGNYPMGGFSSLQSTWTEYLEAIAKES